MNAGQTADEIFHAVEPDPELATRPFLRATYDHPKFIVRNLLRLWGGWWDGNAANLLPAPLGRAGGGDRAAGRRRARSSSRAAARCSTAGDAVMAAHLAEWATRAAPDDRDGAGAQARRLRTPAARRRGAHGARHLPRRDARRAARARRGADARAWTPACRSEARRRVRSPSGDAPISLDAAARASSTRRRSLPPIRPKEGADMRRAPRVWPLAVALLSPVLLAVPLAEPRRAAEQRPAALRQRHEQVRPAGRQEPEQGETPAR